jgi:NAD-specific glutamate dehydrogenase
VTLDGAEGAITVGNGLTLGHLANQHFTVASERDDGGRGATTFGIGDNDGLAGLKDRNDGVGCTEIDTYCFGHGGLLARFER